MGEGEFEYAGHDLEAMTAAVRYHRWIIEEISPFVGRRVAEIGAGVGSVAELLLSAIPSPERLTLVEPSPAMFRTLSRRFRGVPGVVCLNGTLAELVEPVDTLLYLNVLEHVKDDAAEVKRAAVTLTPGGHLILFVPALSCLYSKFDRSIGHYRRYGMRELKKIVVEGGFDIVSARYFDIVGIIPWYLLFVVMGKRGLGGSVSLYDRIVVPVMRRVEKLFTPPVGKNILLVGRRR